MESSYTEKPWGFFVVLATGVDYRVKMLVLKPNNRTSLQRHKHRREVLIPLDDGIQIYRENEIYKKGDVAVIKENELHRIENTGKEKARVLEVWLGNILSEDDIERIEDDYGRV